MAPGRKGIAKEKTMKVKAKRGGKGKKTLSVFKRYTHRVLKQMHPEMCMTKTAADVMESMMTDLYGRLSKQAAELSAYRKAKTLSADDFQAASRLIFPGQLGRHAIAEGIKAVKAFEGSVTDE